MTPLARVPADLRAEIVRLRGERMGLTYHEIGQITGVAPATVEAICRAYYGDQVARAAAALKREVALARREAATAPLYHPEGWP